MTRSAAPAGPPGPASHAAAVQAYLDRLSPSSRPVATSVLNRMARRLSAGAHTMATFPWAALTPAQVSVLWAWLAATYAPATRRHMLAFLRGVLRSCWRVGLLDVETRERLCDWDPVRGSTIRQGRALTPDELRALFAAADPPMRALLAVMAGAGLRVAEAVGLSRADVDPVAGTLRVRHGKGGTQRVAQLADCVRPFLAAHWAAAPPGPLWPISTHTAWARLQRLCDAAGVRRCGTHDLRRTTATRGLDQGIPIAEVQRLLGHASPRTTALYDMAPERRARAAARRLELF